MNQTSIDKDPLIHFPFYINQYQGILSRYSLEEKGAFISLLCVFLVEDSQLPDSQDQLFRMCLAFTESERKAILSVKEKVIETGLEILKYQKEKREKCRESARIGGLARVAKAQAIAEETLKRSSSNTEKEIEKEIEKEDIRNLKSQFEEIYRLYNQGKKLKVIPFNKQKVKFQNCLKEVSLDELKQNIEDYLKYLATATWRQKKSFEAWINSSEFYANDWKSEGSLSTGNLKTTQDSFCQSLNQSLGQDLIKSLIEGEIITIKLATASANDKWDALNPELRNQILEKVKTKFGKNTKVSF